MNLDVITIAENLNFINFKIHIVISRCIYLQKISFFFSVQKVTPNPPFDLPACNKTPPGVSAKGVLRSITQKIVAFWPLDPGKLPPDFSTCFFSSPIVA